MITSQILLKDALAYSKSVKPTEILVESITYATSLPKQNFFVYDHHRNRLDINDIYNAFAFIDAVEWLIIHAMNSCLLHTPVIDKVFLENGLSQLEALQACHCELVKKCWEKQIPIWSYDQRGIKKIEGVLYYTIRAPALKIAQFRE